MRSLCNSNNSSKHKAWFFWGVVSLYTQDYWYVGVNVELPTRLPRTTHTRWPYPSPKSDVLFHQQRQVQEEHHLKLCPIWMKYDKRCSVCWIFYDTDNLLLMAAILWIVTTFACVRQPSSFSVSTAGQWAHFTWPQDYEHNEMQC